MNAAAIKPVSKFSVGLTGGIGSGKTKVANAFAERGASIIDTDDVAHRLTAADGAAIPAIESAFGTAMLTPEGALNRAKMREAVFSEPTQKSLLESILHPMIRSEVARLSYAAPGPYLMYVVPLLAETGHWKFDRILVVDCDENHQIQRVMQRDNLSEALIKSIIAQQATRQQRLAMASDVLTNEGTFELLIPEIDRLHKLYSDLSSSN